MIDATTDAPTHKMTSPAPTSTAGRIVAKTANWIAYRAQLRWPAAVARVTGELPLRPVAGIFTEKPARPGRIPNVVYQTWMDDRFGRSHGNGLAAFQALNPGWEFRLFTDADVDAYMRERWGDHPIHEVYLNGLFGPLKTDIWRYCILFDRGGAYCDIAKAATTPLDAMIGGDDRGFISWERRDVSPFAVTPKAKAGLQHPHLKVINWMLAFEKGDPLLGGVIEGIAQRYPAFKGRVFDDPKRAILDFTGPVWLTRCVLDAAEADALDGLRQLGIEFHGTAVWGLPGAYTRYIGKPAYVLSRGQAIVA